MAAHVETFLRAAPRLERIVTAASLVEARLLACGIARDKLDAKHEIRLVLDKYAEAHGISPKAINELVWGYVDFRTHCLHRKWVLSICKETHHGQ